MKYLSQLVRILLLTVGIFSYDSLFSQTTTFNSSGTYTIPAGVTQIKVEAWGGGGRGGSRTSGSSDSYGGGGGGAYASSIVNVTPLANYTVTVGLGSNNNANPGGDSWFSPNNLTNAIVLAKGGNSVPNNSTTGANGGYYADCIGDIRNNGGRGADGVHSGHGSGGGGASAGSTGIGPSAIDNFGAIAATGNDGTGGNGQTGNGNGSNGGVPGGGGGGARRTSGSPTGGTGANGRIIITILGPQFTTTITGDTTWVAPAGVTAIEVEAWGAGGRGGQRSNNGRGGGGGGGAYSRGLVSVTPGQTYYINVGAGSTTTNAGQSSWFNATNVAPNSDNFVLAVGGSSAPDDSNNGATGGSLTNGYGNQEKRSGGNGANSTGSSTGGGGASAGSGANGGNAVNGTGGIAPVGGGNGANGHNSNNTNGNAGATPGGGGSGARRSNGGTRLGGAGANGQVIIHTFYNLAIQKTVNTTTPLVGSNVTFTISVTNTGTNTARGVSVLDQIPTGLTFVSASTPTQGTFNTANLTWTIGELAPSASAAVTLTATVNATGNYTNRAILSANLTNQSSNTSAVTVFPQQPTSDLQIIKEVDSSMSLIGDEVVFTLTAYNAGPQNATGVTVQDILPLGFTYVSTSGAYDANSGIWTVGNLNSGASTTLTITAIINPIGNHYNQATISGNQTDPNLSNNSSAIMVYPMYPITEIVLPCGTMNYDLSSFDIGTPPPGAEISWHTSTPADDSNKVMSPTNTEAGKTYYVAFYDPVQNCYGSTSVVKITRSCLITNPMIRQQVR